MNIQQTVLQVLVALGVTAMTLTAADSPRASKGRKVVFVVGEREYETKDTLPLFAAKQLVPLGMQCEFVFAASDGGDDDRHNFPNIEESLTGADLVLISVRRRALHPSQMDALKKHLDAGRPLIGIRTSSHAFHTRGKHPKGYVEWETFDADVFGGNYHGHHKAGPKAKVSPQKSLAGHAFLNGVTQFDSDGSLYEVRPLKADTTVLLTGAIPDKEAEPVAWTRLYKGKGRIFCTSLGHANDFADPNFVRLLKNAVLWGLQ